MIDLHRAKVRQIVWLIAAGVGTLLLTRTMIARTLSDAGMLTIQRALGSAHDLPSLEMEKAIDLLETAAAWDIRESAVLPRRKGLALLLSGQPRQALDLLLRASYDKRDVLASYWLGITYEQLGDFDRAAQAWLSVDFQRILLQRADAWLASGKIEQADSMYATILKAEPQSIRALLGQGRVAKSRGDWALAAVVFDKVLAIMPESAEGLVERGMVYYYGEHHIDSALAEFDYAIQLTPQCYWCYLVYADVARDAGRFDRAAQVLNLVLSKNLQQDSLVYRKLGQLLLENLNEPAKAENICRQGLKLYTQDADLYYWLGRAEEKLGNHEAAVLAWQQAVMLAPAVIEYQNALNQVK